MGRVLGVAKWGQGAGERKIDIRSRVAMGTAEGNKETQDGTLLTLKWKPGQD